MIWSAVVYGVWFAAWVVLELLGLKHRRGGIPWTTLSSFVRALEARQPWLRIVILSGLTVLSWHLVSPGGFP